MIRVNIPSFIKIGSGIQKSMGAGIHTQTQRQEGDFIFFQNEKCRLIKTTIKYLIILAIILCECET
jgi:hypothetical protein